MKTAILITSYSKTHTLKKVIDSLSLNKKYDLFVFLDKNDDINITNQLSEISKTYTGNTEVIIRSKRFGADLNDIASINDVFIKGYDRVFFLEDDVIVDKNCLETLENLMDWTDKNIPNIGIVQSWNYNLTQEPYLSEYKKLHGIENLYYDMSFDINEIGYTCQNFWCALISKECWIKSYPFISRHFSTLLQNKGFNFINFRDEVAKLMISNASNEVKRRLIQRYHPNSWECQFDLAMNANNMFKICLTNPRSKTIGIEGLTSTNDMFTKVGLDKIQTANINIIPTEFKLNIESSKKFLMNF